MKTSDWMRSPIRVTRDLWSRSRDWLWKSSRYQPHRHYMRGPRGAGDPAGGSGSNQARE